MHISASYSDVKEKWSYHWELSSMINEKHYAKAIEHLKALRTDDSYFQTSYHKENKMNQQKHKQRDGVKSFELKWRLMNFSKADLKAVQIQMRRREKLFFWKIKKFWDGNMTYTVCFREKARWWELRKGAFSKQWEK